MEKKEEIKKLKFWRGEPGWIYHQTMDGERGVSMSFDLQIAMHNVDFTETQYGSFHIDYVRLYDDLNNPAGHYFAPVQDGWENDEETGEAVELRYENDGELGRFQTFEEAVDAIEVILQEVYELYRAKANAEAI